MKTAICRLESISAYSQSKFYETEKLNKERTDTYRIGVSKQSQSTMHTIMRRKITQSMFSEKIPVSYVKQIEKLRTENDFIKLKSLLPECFLQRRIVNLNYMSLRNIIKQRENHKLLEWKSFCQYMKEKKSTTSSRNGGSADKM